MTLKEAITLTGNQQLQKIRVNGNEVQANTLAGLNRLIGEIIRESNAKSGKIQHLSQPLETFGTFRMACLSDGQARPAKLPIFLTLANSNRQWGRSKGTAIRLAGVGADDPPDPEYHY